MSSYISGAGSAAWAGVETAYGAGYQNNASLLNMTGESLSSTFNMLDEGTLLASKTRPAQDLGSVDVSGSINTVLKYDFINWLMKATMGIEESVASADPDYRSGYTTKRYKLAAPGGDLASSWLRLMRGTQGFDYDGMIIGSTALDCTAQDFVKADINFTGRKETYAGPGPAGAHALNWGTWKATKPANDTVGSYKCTRARLFNHAAAGTTPIGVSDFSTYLAAFNDIDWSESSCPAQQVWDVSRAQLTIDNGLEDVPATYCSGLYGNEPTFGQRTVTLSCEVPYSQSFENFRQANYAKENADNLALMLAFCSKETHTEVDGTDEYTFPDHEVIILIPNVSFDSAAANVSGQGLINGSFTGTALSVGTVEPITVLVRNKDSV